MFAATGASFGVRNEGSRGAWFCEEECAKSSTCVVESSEEAVDSGEVAVAVDGELMAARNHANRDGRDRKELVVMKEGREETRSGHHEEAEFWGEEEEERYE